MSQPYPDPPVSSKLVKEKTWLMEQLWWRWLSGLLKIVNRLSGGLGVNGTFPLAPLTTGGTVGSITIQDGTVTQIIPST